MDRLAPPEAQRRRVIRKAAGGLAAIVHDDDEHTGRWVCPECPDDRFTPPFLAFGLLRIHRREHEARTGHHLLLYCYVCCDFHDPAAAGVPLGVRWLAEGPPPLSATGLGAVLAALETLRRVGYSVNVLAEEPPALPEPERVLLPWAEVETLRLIRAQPGITSRQVAAIMGLARTTVRDRLKLLKRAGHVRDDGMDAGGFHRLYPAHDKPLRKVRPRSIVNYRSRYRETSVAS